MTSLQLAQALSADAVPAEVDWKSVVSPILGGAIIGLVCFSLAKKVGISEPQAKGVALAMGAVTAVGQIASSWLKGWTNKALASVSPAPATPESTSLTYF